MTPLDAADLRTARVAVLWFIASHQRDNRPAPPAAHRLLDHLTRAMSAAGPKPVAPQQQFIGTTEAAKRLGITPRHARRIAQRLGVLRVGNRYLIPLDAVEEHYDNNIT